MGGAIVDTCRWLPFLIGQNSTTVGSLIGSILSRRRRCYRGCSSKRPKVIDYLVDANFESQPNARRIHQIQLIEYLPQQGNNLLFLFIGHFAVFFERAQYLRIDPLAN
jgi:hypothetical protein